MNMVNEGKILIGMTLKNGAMTLRRAVESVPNQKGVKKEIVLLIANDASTDNWQEVISDYLGDARIIVKNVNFGKTYAVRNFILDYVRKHIPDAEYIGRLDSDDFIADVHALSKIEHIIDLYAPDVIIAGNKQLLNNTIVTINRADRRLLDMNYLKKRLFQMANGIVDGELPSCNVFVRPTVEVRYKDVESAEDHWYTVDLLLNSDRYNIYLAEDLIYAVYSLEGNVTRDNKKRHAYLKSRKELYEYFLKKMRGDAHE